MEHFDGLSRQSLRQDLQDQVRYDKIKNFVNLIESIQIRTKLPFLLQRSKHIKFM
ncbi:hypothetical protein KSU1_D0314 [Candidatus Jettenia caeni]|uniref:Uncharacterized protein n=1 Tax=Candidatus Jettenia caeni TaxID=247490 RepID=I3IPH8_9BACT|nr:hypothetical protein KSU1_D0314 [Candidatus Jettenia caeni]